MLVWLHFNVDLWLKVINLVSYSTQVEVHNSAMSKHCRGLAVAWKGGLKRTRNTQKTHTENNPYTNFFVTQRSWTVLGANWVQKFSTLCVKRYGMTHRTYKGGKVCVQKQFQQIAMPKSCTRIIGIKWDSWCTCLSYCTINPHKIYCPPAENSGGVTT